MNNYDAVLFLSFGGPEGPDDVMPFLRNVLRGKNVPEARMHAVAHHYELFGGISPLNGQNRVLIKKLQEELASRNIELPVFWGNRNWHPLLPDTLLAMEEAGVKRALAFVTSAYSSYSGCRQYLEDIERARQETGVTIEVDKIRIFNNHPLFVQANADHVREGLAEFDEEPYIVFTAHSIPLTMAETCAYAAQLEETCALINKQLGDKLDYKLVYQSRSGPPSQPWLEPDVCDYLRELKNRGVKNVLIHPVGFISDHMEIVYDLDTEARTLASELEIKLVRSKTAGTHNLFAKLMGDLVEERLKSKQSAQFIERPALGTAAPDFCNPTCCAYTPVRPDRPSVVEK